MIIDTSIIETSIQKATKSKIDHSELNKKIDEIKRSEYISEEQRSRYLRQLMIQMGQMNLAKRKLKQIMSGNDLTSINYLSKGLVASSSICKISIRDENGKEKTFGTGFLVAPGILMTNQHVIKDSTDAENAVAQFDFELDENGNQRQVVEFDIASEPEPIAVKHLDFSLLVLSIISRDGAKNLRDYGWLQLNPNPGKAIVGEYLTIIQHPKGEHKQICVRENKLLRYDSEGNTLWYATDTVAGSSGSPVFNNFWQVVAIHHSGVPKMDSQKRWLTTDNQIWNPSMDESQIAWIANEGIRISKILKYLEDNFENNPIAKEVLNASAHKFS